MRENPKSFIPAWLNNSDLSQADFRVYCCLAARADTRTGLAWPQADTIAKDCKMARNTVWKSLRSLEDRIPPLIRKSGKPFGGSNRYQILIPPIGANGTLIDSLPIGANEAPIGPSPNRRKSDTPIGANEILQSAQMDSREGITNNSNQVTVTKGDFPELPFQSDQFKTAWSEWETHRKEIKKKLTPSTKDKQLSALKTMGEEAAIESINKSITSGWTGIFPPSQPRSQQTTSPVITTNRPATITTI